MKKPRTIMLEDLTWNKLQEIADSKFTSVSAIIRQAIHEKIERETEKTDK